MARVGDGLAGRRVVADGNGSQCSKAATIQVWAVRSLAWFSVGLAVYAASVPAGAQYPADAAPGALPPAEILVSVRIAGFSPLSRPVQRGAVYTLFATDRYLFDVRLTVDARTGRVLRATRLAGAFHGGPVYEGALPGAYPFYDGGQRSPVPPALVPRRNAAAAPAAQPPLPRSRPDNGAEAVPAAAAPVEGSESAATAQPLAPALPPASPERPAMVPIAPF